ncbi:hypothetical protein [Sphaerisporangium perillae]|uniref:hypothetical protein n=1 Tax=Sphaerisporangium perillae TaxID=2935860 RepID=UPI00200EABF4|nr:hypothetical protein [Sphaerisporangium perillae]
MTTSRIDELVAGLTGVHDDQLAGPSTPGARRLLTAITAEEPATAVTVRRRRRYGRFAVGVVVATGVAATAVVALSAGGPGPIRGYANAAVDIQRTDGTYKVHVKNAYADQRQFHEAFAKFGLDMTLSIVPVSPGYERKIIGGISDGTGTIGTVLDCPPGQGTACPLTVTLSGITGRQGATKIMIGRLARPGEPYWNARPGAGDSPASLRLSGGTVAEALAKLHERNMSAVYVIGEFHQDGSGSAYNPPPT